MISRPPSLAILLSLTLAIAGASAQTSGAAVYRCGAGGSEYSAKPCPEGSAVNVADPRSTEQQRQARCGPARNDVGRQAGK